MTYFTAEIVITKQLETEKEKQFCETVVFMGELILSSMIKKKQKTARSLGSLTFL